MNFDGNFKFLGSVDVSELKLLILEFSEDEWEDDSWRQEKYEVHKYTQTISLLFDLDFRHKNPTKHKNYSKFKKALIPLIEFIKSNLATPDYLPSESLVEESYPIRINLVRLLPNGQIPSHNDKNYSLSHAHRIHIPIITNKNVIFTVNHEPIHIKTGEVVEINNKLVHNVKNMGDEIRTHIIIDWVIPNERCCCGLKHFPSRLCNPDICQKFDYSPILCGCYTS